MADGVSVGVPFILLSYHATFCILLVYISYLTVHSPGPVVRLSNASRSVGSLLAHFFDFDLLDGLLHRPSVISDLVPCSHQREQLPSLATVTSLVIALLGFTEDIWHKSICSTSESPCKPQGVVVTPFQ